MGAEPLSDEGLAKLVGSLSSLYAEMPDGWVFGGVLLKSDYEFIENVESNGPWVAIATRTHSTDLGPIPEARGYGSSMASAIDDLRSSLDAYAFRD